MCGLFPWINNIAFYSPVKEENLTMRKRLLVIGLTASLIVGVAWVIGQNKGYASMLAVRIEGPAKPVDYKTIAEIPAPEGFVRRAQPAKAKKKATKPRTGPW